MEVDINYLAVFLAGASTMVVGAIWYSKSVFGTVWSKLAKVDLSKPPKAGKMAWLMSTTFLASVLTAYILAHVTALSAAFFDKTFLEAALTTGFWLWLGLVATRVYVHDAFEGRRKKLTLLTVSHELVTIMVMALVIGLMGQ
jgi:hypothetical protein